MAIGSAIAEQLAAEGAAIVANYSSSKAGGEKVVKEIAALGRKAFAVQTNVLKRQDTSRAGYC